MDKIISFCKQKYKMLIPIMVIIVLFVTIFFLYREYKYDNYRDKKDVSVFQYFGGIRTDYTAIVTYNLKKAIVDVSAKNAKIDYDSTPIYYSKDDKVIFPTEMTIAFPLREGSQYKLYKYSLLYKEDKLNYIKNNTDIGNYENFFLYDGRGLFYFPNSVSLNINGKEYKKLGDMSYVSLVGGYTLIYYDKATDTSEVKEITNEIITITSENIEININEKYSKSFGNKVLLIGPDNLNVVFKTIDK